MTHYPISINTIQYSYALSVSKMTKLSVVLLVVVAAIILGEALKDDTSQLQAKNLQSTKVIHRRKTRNGSSKKKNKRTKRKKPHNNRNKKKKKESSRMKTIEKQGSSNWQKCAATLLDYAPRLKKSRTIINQYKRIETIKKLIESKRSKVNY